MPIISSRPPFAALRLTSPRQEHPAVAWLQTVINERSERYVRPPLVVDGIFGRVAAAECEELFYRLGRKRNIPAASVEDLQVLWGWTRGEQLPADWRARRIARMATGFRPGWGISWRVWKALHPAKYGRAGYDPAAAADVMLAWARAGYRESPAGSNVVPQLVELARKHQVRDDVAGMGYAWCQFAAYLAGLVAGGGTARAGLVERAFWPLYTPFTLDFGRKSEHGHWIVSAAEARKGDMAMFNFGSRDPVQHVGRLIEPPADGLVRTVDGNTSVTSDDSGGAVMVRARSAATVVAYVRDS